MPTTITKSRRSTVNHRKRPPASRSDGAASLLQRNSTLSRWGNSLGLRIPRDAADHLHLKAGEQVQLEVRDDSITIRPVRPRTKWTLDRLLQGVTPSKVGGELNWGNAVGAEAL